MCAVCMDRDSLDFRSLGRAGRTHMPGAGSIIASSLTSPIDVIYLATIFDPMFTQSYAGTELVRPLSLTAALVACFSIPRNPEEDGDLGLTTLAKLSKANPSRIIAVFPEGTASNGRSILRLTPSLLSASPTTKIFPVSIRYTPQDIVTPIPGWFESLRFLWRLFGKSSHTIRTRIGTYVVNKSATASPTLPNRSGKRNYESNFFDTLDSSTSDGNDDDNLSEKQREVLDAVADTLARLGRVKRVSLGIVEKSTFVQAWQKGSRSRR